ncbi:hypothetical protein C8R45DRAFT_943247 [Mycena sanguinolenta]|nr:hypothetical protein C8R45DRAFT_1221894 [Mycena sanguinolenta]KAJ6457287.1 hypothetical protein C8R45DRAFT_943247 [Mycena sanguinolenta]
MQPETWNASWYIAPQSLRYTTTTMYSSPPGQRYSHVPDSYANQAYGYGGNYSGMDDQRMHIFPPTSGPSPSVLGSTLTHPPQKKKEAHTKQRKYEDEDDSDSEGVASVDSDSDDDSDWRERERRKWGKAPPPVVPPGAAEFQHSVRSTHPFHPLHIPFDNSSPFIPFSRIIEFKRKGALMAGISLLDAQSTQTKLAGNDYYTLHDLHADRRAGGRIHVRVYWAEFSHLTYEIPLDVHDGRVIMEALSRRVARACSHYLACNMAPVMYNRVELHHLREIAYGVWQPMLSAH